MVTMEATPYKALLVASGGPVLRYAVVSRVDGMVVDATPYALGSAAAGLVQDPDRWRQLSGAAQLRAQEFTWRRVAQDLLCAVSPSTRSGAGLSPPDTAAPSCRQASAPPVYSAHFTSEPHAYEDQ